MFYFHVALEIIYEKINNLENNKNVQLYSLFTSNYNLNELCAHRINQNITLAASNFHFKFNPNYAVVLAS